jgi:hypothetical protein
MSLSPRRRNGLMPMKSVSGTGGIAEAARCLSGAAETHAGLITTVALYAIILLATINVMLRFPDLGALIESYNKF